MNSVLLHCLSDVFSNWSLSTECGACGLSRRRNAEFSLSFLTSSCLGLCRKKNAVSFRVSAFMVRKEYNGFPSNSVPVLPASCIPNGAHGQYIEKSTGCNTQPWVLVWICFAPLGVWMHLQWDCLIKIIPIPKCEHSLRQDAKLGQMWSTCTSVS